MTQEDKNLLYNDLCARIPYKVKCYAFLQQIDKSLKSIYGTLKGITNGYATVNDNLVDASTVKPILRPLSNMTDAEKKEYHDLCVENEIQCRDTLESKTVYYNTMESFDWLLSHHFDIHGLIDKNLAWEDTENIYKL